MRAKLAGKILITRPEEDAKPLASGSTLARFAQAFTRRDADASYPMTRAK